MKTMQVPAGSKCAACGQHAELGVTSTRGEPVLLFCRACARRIAAEHNLPHLARLVAQHEPS
jgi:hypothetical protein